MAIIFETWLPGKNGKVTHGLLTSEEASGTRSLPSFTWKEVQREGAGHGRAIFYRSGGSRLLDIPVLDVAVVLGPSKQAAELRLTLRCFLRRPPQIELGGRLELAGKVWASEWKVENSSISPSGFWLDELGESRATVKHPDADGFNDPLEVYRENPHPLFPRSSQSDLSFVGEPKSEVPWLFRLQTRTWSQTSRLNPDPPGLLGRSQWILDSSNARSLRSHYLAVWNDRIAKPSRSAIRTAKDGQELTFVPVLRDGKFDGQAARLVALMSEASEKGVFLAEDRLAKSPSLSDSPEKFALDLERFELIAHASAECKAVAWFNGLRSIEGKALNGLVSIVPSTVAEAATLIKSERTTALGAIAFGMEPVGEFPKTPGQLVQPAAPSWTAAIGSLDLTLGERILTKPNPGDLDSQSFCRGALREWWGRSDEDDRPEVRVQMNFSVSQVAPGGQDDAPGEPPSPHDLQRPALAFANRVPHRSRPLLLADKNQVTKGEFRLIASEHSDTARREVSLVLKDARQTAVAAENAAIKAPVTMIVIDPEPFLIAKVEIPPFASAGDDPEIANWSGYAAHGASWELRSGAVANIWMPPQAVGEQMEKYPGAGPSHFPANGRSPAQPIGDLDEGKVADFRFSPPARLSVRPSYFQQRFVEAPWNLRRIFGYPGQRAPGAGVDAMRLELLYGLETSIEGSSLRLAELSSRLGALVGTPALTLSWPGTRDQKERHRKFLEDWARLLEIYSRRLAILDPWLEAQPNKPFSLDRGVVHSLRGLDHPRPADLAYPIPGAGPWDNLAHRIPNPGSGAVKGLAGGVSWGFESNNVYNAVWRESDSSSGEIRRLHLSALGGWGYLKAGFDRDLSKVYADVAMGRTFYYSLERIGRIGVFWNRAKHVIVYDRTVAPSEQFRSSDDVDHHAGRPVLRKTREYVEIIEQKRSYPEFGAPERSRGPILGTEFKSRQIAVNSRWGRDVGTVGWQVPLWNRKEAEKNPKVYVRPEIYFVAAADPSSGAETTRLEIAEPETLCFFTDTRDPAVRSSDTDRWPAVAEVDFADVPTPKQDKEIPAIEPINPDAILPAPAAIEGGIGKFTWNVRPSERPVNLVASRSDQVIAADLHNVSMMRTDPAPDASSWSKKSEAEKLLGTAATLGRVFAKTSQTLLAQLPTGGQLSDEVKRRLSDVLQSKAWADDLTSLFNDLAAQLKTLDPAMDCGGLADKAYEALLAIVDQQLVALEQRAVREVRDLAAGLTAGGIDAARRPLYQWVDRVEDAAAALLDAAAFGFEATGDPLRSLQAAIVDLRAESLAAVGRARTIVQGANVVTATTIARLREGLALEVDTVKTRIRRLHALLDRSRNDRWAAKVAAIRKAVDAFEATFLAAAEVVDRKLIEAATTESLDEAIKALQTLRELVEPPLAIEAEIGDALTALDNLAKSTDKLAESVESELKVLREAIGVATSLDPLVGQLESSLAALRADLQQLVRDGIFSRDFKNAIAKACALLREALAEQVAELDDLRRALLAELQKAIDVVGQSVAGLRAAFEQLLAAAAVRLEAVLDSVIARIAKLAGEAGAALHQVGSTLLRLLRAFGDPPRAPNLDFNRPQLAYYFDLDLPEVDMTPVAAFFQRLGDDLKGFGLRLPSYSLGDRILPELGNLNLATVFPDFGGIRLDGMLPGIKLPSIATNAIKVRHGIDPQTRRGWVEAEIDVPITDACEVFTIGPLTVRLLRSRFNAIARGEMGLEGQVARRESGEIRGDWELQVGGTPIVRFRDTTIRYEQGKMHFDLSPDKVEMPGALKFIADLIKKTGVGDSGLTFRMLEVNGLPAGVEALLDLPLPDIGAGAFSLSKLHLGASLALQLEAGENGLDFKLATRFHVGTRDKPFVMAIALLTGGGWVDARAMYKPATGEVQTAVSIGIVAGVSAAFQAGPVAGGVYLLFGVEAEFVASSRGGGGLYIAQVLIVYGEATVWGFISIGLHLRLALVYGSDDGSLIGTGRLAMTIKISRFFQKSFETEARYAFKKGKSSGKKPQGAKPVPVAALAGSAPARLASPGSNSSKAGTASLVASDPFDDLVEAAHTYLLLISG